MITYNPTGKELVKTHFKKWEWFRLADLFEIRKGKRLTKEDMLEGSTPFIGSSEQENGVTAHISNNPIHTGNTISVTYNGSVAEAFYQPKDFWASDDVNVLYPKFKLNQYIALFFVTLIRKEKYRFSYGRKWHTERMAESKIKLPVDQNNVVALDIIEKYMINLCDITELTSKLSKKSVDTKLNLSVKNWEWFKLCDLFAFEGGKCGSAEKLLEKGVGVSYVGAKKEDNGFMYEVIRDEGVYHQRKLHGIHWRRTRVCWVFNIPRK